MTPIAFRALALGLPDAHEEPHFDRTSFRVGKRIFSTMTPSGDEAMVRVLVPELLDSLLASHPDVFFSYGKWTTRHGSLGIRLRKAPRAMLETLLIESWKHVAPKRAVTAYLAGRSL